MNDETRKLFVAPWEATAIKGIEWGVRIKDSGLLLCDFCEEENAKRFARLPELYDALMEAAKEYCESCIRDEHFMGNIPSSDIKIIENGCPFNNTPCKAFNWLELLKKVRDGK